MELMIAVQRGTLLRALRVLLKRGVSTSREGGPFGHFLSTAESTVIAD
jgi:hypothetical protein